MKKKITVILMLILIAIVCAGVAVIQHGRQEYRVKERIQGQQQEEDRASEAWEKMEIQRKKEEEEIGEEKRREEKAADKAKEVSGQEEAEKTADISGEGMEAYDLEKEAQIQKPAHTTEATEGMPELKSQLETMVEGYAGDWSIYVKNLSSGESMELNSHQVKAASLIKLYIMGAVLEQIELGNLVDDENIGQLLRDMIVVSDNESSNELVRRLSPNGMDHEEGMKVVNAFASAHGYVDTWQGRDLKDVREVPADGENWTSVKDCGMFLQQVYEGKCVSPEASARMLGLLEQQTRIWKIPKGLPEGTKTANKTGELGDTENDVAIVYSPSGPYILCVMSTALTDTIAAQANIVSISGEVYNYMNDMDI